MRELRPPLSMVLAFLCAGCPAAELPYPRPLPPARERPAPARAHRVEGRAPLRGPFASASRGDFILENGRVVVVVAGLASPSPGALVDAGRTGGADALRNLSPLVGVDAAAPRFERIEVEHLGGAATVRLDGFDPAAPHVRVLCEYSLHPGSNVLRIITTLQNRGRAALAQYKVGDQLDWGEAEPFAPGLGRAVAGQPELAWVGAFSVDAAYAYFRRTPLAADFTGPLTRVILETLELRPGRSAPTSRHLAIGAGGQIASLLPAVFSAQGIPTGILELSVLTQDGEPLAGATVEVLHDRGLLAVGRSDMDGAMRLELPPGPHVLRAVGVDRLGRAEKVDLDAGVRRALHLETGPPSRLLFEVRDADSGAKVPARLTLLGLEGTRTPWLGPAHAAAAGNQLLSVSGEGSLPLPPGRYRVVVTRGPEHTIHKEDLLLRPHSGASLSARLRRVVDTAGYVAVDPGEQTRASAGSAVPLEVRRLAATVEGLAAVALTETGEASAPVSAAGLLLIPAISSTDDEHGTFSLLAPRAPVSLDPDVSLLQLEHPLRPGAGLLARKSFDPARPDPTLIPAGVAALRILDADRPFDFEPLLESWLALLRCGRRLAATAASGSRSVLSSTAGYPRTYVEQPAGTTASPASIVEALRGGRSVLSSGPFLRVTAGGVAPGGTLRLEKKARRRRGKPQAVSVRVVVQAPAWMGLDEARLYLNGKPHGAALPIPGHADGARLDETVSVPVDEDSFLVVLVKGQGPLQPVVQSPGPLRPMALSNPVWIDADADGEVSLSCTP